jgi:cysteine desulfurase NifS
VVKLEDADRESLLAATRRPTRGDRCAATEPLPRARHTRRIYLDNNATTRVAEGVREAMLPYLEDGHGNPSSIHSTGRNAREAIETARRRTARLIGARPRQVQFTGSGTESDNQALKGVAQTMRARGRHLITSAVEHPAVLGSCDYLERLGWRITRLPVDPDGLVDPDDLERALTDDTVLVSIMMANNEVGTVQPIAELCALAHRRGALFHTDAVQAVGKIPVDVQALGVDLLTLSGHKFHGPKGVGALYVRRGLELEPLVHGGKQEGGRRAGTENVPAIVGMGKAAELALHDLPGSVGMGELRDRLETGIKELVPEARLNGHPTRRLPNTLNLTLPGLRGESVVMALDRFGVSLSSGSACKSGSPEPTHVLLAMGRSVDEAHCSLRFSLSAQTTREDIRDTVSALSEVLDEHENTVRFLPCK